MTTTSFNSSFRTLPNAEAATLPNAEAVKLRTTISTVSSWRKLRISGMYTAPASPSLPNASAAELRTCE
ncbi:MAG: hypothetical protein RIE73_12775 [Coleofasciculus sp. C1-SOL-03]|uniref:hypothetical protein n=1 Tax=Coleofasciculus sp. C1-SOL-03 TaxID=3069522 RepID=UPI0032F321DF